MTARIEIANPLPSALAHYVTELRQTLERVGIVHESYPARRVEGERGARGKLTMLCRALANAWLGQRSRTPVFVVWPSLGLFDALLWRAKRTQHFVVLHDPIPIRRQFGYGRFARWLVRRRISRTPVIVTHSEDAYEVAVRLLPRHTHLLLLHPICTHQAPARTSPTAVSGAPVVLVAGQFKPERNIALLSRLGPRLVTIGVTGKVVGRDWPSLPCWETHSRFVSEDELDSELAAAAVVLIPYHRYYQSGIAIRALELGTLSISADNSFARALLGAANTLPSAATDEHWLAAIQQAVAHPELTTPVFERYLGEVDVCWTALRDRLLTFHRQRP